MRMVWQDGEHLMTQGDVEAGDVGVLLGIEELAEVVYTDPPWNAGIAKRMRQWAGDEGEADLGHLLDCLAEIIARRARYGFVQMGHGTGAKRLEQALDGAGLKYQAHECSQIVNDKTWERGKSALLYAIGAEIVVDPNAGWTNLCRDTIAQVAAPGAIVLDPFVGQGMTLRVCDAEGWTCYGMDLNAKRVDEGVKRLLRDRGTGREGLYES